MAKALVASPVKMFEFGDSFEVPFAVMALEGSIDLGEDRICVLSSRVACEVEENLAECDCGCVNLLTKVSGYLLLQFWFL
jgi:hypothetical protein